MPLISTTTHYERVGHHLYPAKSGRHGAFGELELDNAYVRFNETSEIDTVIAELVALRAEMAAGDEATAVLAASIESGTSIVIVEDEPETVPWPTGFCGHQVAPDAWALGFTFCRDCTIAPALYDRVAAGGGS